MSKTALITGANGQDGSYLCELLISKGYRVVGMVRRSSSMNLQRIRGIENDITIVQGDLTDQGSLLSIVEQYQPDEIYNLAAMSHVQVCLSQYGTSTQKSVFTKRPLVKCLAKYLKYHKQKQRLFIPEVRMEWRKCMAIGLL